MKEFKETGLSNKGNGVRYRKTETIMKVSARPRRLEDIETEVLELLCDGQIFREDMSVLYVFNT